MDDDNEAATIAALESACPALARLGAHRRDVFVDGTGKVHADADCAGGGDNVSMTVADLTAEFLCPSCARDLDDQVVGLDQIIYRLGDLLDGPRIEDCDGDPRARVDQVIRNAEAFAAGRSEVSELLDTIGGDDAAELAVFVDEISRRWRPWFETVGVAELMTLARVAGPDSIVARTTFQLALDLADMATVSSPYELADVVFDALCVAHLNGAQDVRAVVAEMVLPRELMFSSDVENVSAADVAAMAGDGADLHTILDRVRATARRRDIDVILDVLEPRIAADGDGDAWQLVVTRDENLALMFWGEALRCCFPSQVADGFVVLAVPALIAGQLTATVHDPLSFAVGSIWVLELTDSDAAQAVTTVAALIGDGLDPEEALTTATAVLH